MIEHATSSSVHHDHINGVLRSIDLLTTSMEKYENLAITKCGHFIRSIDEASYGDRVADYEAFERVCPMCKSPANTLVAIFADCVANTLAHPIGKVSPDYEWNYEDFCKIFPATEEETVGILEQNGDILTSKCYNKIALEVLCQESHAVEYFSNCVDTLCSS